MSRVRVWAEPGQSTNTQKVLKRKVTPGAGLTADERAVCEIIASEGISTRAAMLEVWPESANWTPGKRASKVHQLRGRGKDYLRHLIEAGAEEAVLGRAQLIEMALQDREFARATGNASAAVAATKNVAMLAGLNLRDEGPANSADPVALLEAVEKLMRAKSGADAIDITPESPPASRGWPSREGELGH